MTTTNISDRTSFTDSVRELLAEEALRDRLYNRISALGGTAAETLASLRTVHQEEAAAIAILKTDVAALQAIIAEHTRIQSRAYDTATDILHEQRETHGAMSDAGMYKVDIGDNTTVSLKVTPTTELLCTPDAGQKLPDECVKIVREPKKAVIKALMQTQPDREFYGCKLVVKTWRSDPPAADSVDWGVR